MADHIRSPFKKPLLRLRMGGLPRVGSEVNARGFVSSAAKSLNLRTRDGADVTVFSLAPPGEGKNSPKACLVFTIAPRQSRVPPRVGKAAAAVCGIDIEQLPVLAYPAHYLPVAPGRYTPSWALNYCGPGRPPALPISRLVLCHCLSRRLIRRS
jgi:hypothetical protein